MDYKYLYDYIEELKKILSIINTQNINKKMKHEPFAKLFDDNYTPTKHEGNKYYNPNNKNELIIELPKGKIIIKNDIKRNTIIRVNYNNGSDELFKYGNNKPKSFSLCYNKKIHYDNIKENINNEIIKLT